MKVLAAAAGSAIFFGLAPGVVAGLIPWWLTRWQPHELGEYGGVPIRVVGAMLIVTGTAVLLHAFGRFVPRGPRHTGPRRADGAPGGRRPLPVRQEPDVPGGGGDDRGAGIGARPIRPALVCRRRVRRRRSVRPRLRGTDVEPAVRRRVHAVSRRGQAMASDVAEAGLRISRCRRVPARADCAGTPRPPAFPPARIARVGRRPR
jgi:hypothetical protein